MKLTALSCTLLVLSFSGPCHHPAAQDQAANLNCKSNPRLAGRCYVVKGILGLSGDSGDTILPDHGNGGLVVGSAPNSTGDWPDNLSRAMDKAHKETRFVNAGVHGEFEVCPIPKQGPRPNYVCIEAAKNLTTWDPSRG